MKQAVVFMKIKPSKTCMLLNSIEYDKPVGVIAEDKEQGLVSIAEPVGVICGVTPTTNPTSTTIFKALIAL